VAVCDVDEERLNPTAEEYACKGYVKFEELLENDAVDVVNIATPSGMHAEMGIKAVEAGKHLIVEKPADIVPERIDALVAAGERCGVKVGGIFQSRLDPLNLRIREAIQKGRLGKLIGVHGHLPWYRKQSYYDGPHGSWKGTWDMDGGGSLMNQGVHTVDLLQWLVGRVKSVMGMFGVFGHDIEAEDKTVAVLRFANGALGTLTTTTTAIGGGPQNILIHGDKGTIHKSGELLIWNLADDEQGEEEQELMRYYGAKDRRPEGETVATDPMAVGATGHQFQVQDLARVVREGGEPFIGIEDALHAVEIVNAIYESGRTGVEVTIGQ